MGPKTLAMILVEAILTDLSDRKGIGDELDALTPRMRDDLEGELTDLLQAEIDRRTEDLYTAGGRWKRAAVLDD